MMYDFITPIKDANGNIIDWRIVGRGRASSVESALKFAREKYGYEADVRKSEY